MHFQLLTTYSHDSTGFPYSLNIISKSLDTLWWCNQCLVSFGCHLHQSTVLLSFFFKKNICLCWVLPEEMVWHTVALCRMFGQHEPRLTSCRACRSKHQSLLIRRFLNPMVGNRIWAPTMIVAVWSGGSPHSFWADSRRLHKGYVNPLNEILQNLFFFSWEFWYFKIFWVCISICGTPEHHSSSLFLRSWVAYFQPRGS